MSSRWADLHGGNRDIDFSWLHSGEPGLLEGAWQVFDEKAKFQGLVEKGKWKVNAPFLKADFNKTDYHNISLQP